jgi:hypothetical protein
VAEKSYCPDCGGGDVALEIPLHSDDDIECAECGSTNLAISDSLGLYCRDCQSELDISKISEA